QPDDSFPKTLEKITKLSGGDSEHSQRLSRIFEYLQELGIETHFSLDPSITRGLDYYTGIVFETYLKNVPEIGSVCSGGRYNNLASLYTSEEIPGVGSSIGLDRLLAALEALGNKPDRPSITAVLILYLDENLAGYYHRLAGFLRENGISAEVYPDKKKLAQQFSFAEKKSIPLALICGEEEKKAGAITLKNLHTRESCENLSREEGLTKIKEMLHQQ
ncbi:MAG: HisS family protein, partial [Spirochaetota bacterium]